MKRTIFVLGLLASCAHAPREPRDREIEVSRDQLARDERALQALQADAHVDCPRAGQLRDRICALGDRICALTSATDDRCVDARTRCQAARARVDAVCPRAGGERSAP